MAKRSYQQRLIDETNALFDQMDKAERAKGDKKRVHELLAADLACQLARWIPKNEQFRSDFESVRAARESNGKLLVEVCHSPELYEKFLQAELALLVQRGVRRKVATAIIDSCRGLEGELTRDFDPAAALTALDTLGNLVCREHEEAMKDASRGTGGLLRLVKRVLWLGGGGAVIATNVAGGLTIIVHTFGLGTPLALAAAELSKALGGGLVLKGAALN